MNEVNTNNKILEKEIKTKIKSKDPVDPTEKQEK